MAILIDALLVTIAVFLVARGARRGLILSLLGFLALVAALLGAKYAADHFSPALSVRIAASVEQTVTEQLQGMDFSSGNEQELIGQALPEIVKGYGFYEQAAEQITELVQQALSGLAGELIPAAAAQTAQLVSGAAAEMIVFSTAFVLILLLAWGLGRLLNLVFQLPVLRECNALGGAIFGAAKAVVVLLVAAWLVRYAGLLVPEELVRQTYVLRFLTGLIE